MEKDLLVPVSTWNRITTENQELRRALAFLVADWERVHGPLSEEHEAKVALKR